MIGGKRKQTVGLHHDGIELPHTEAIFGLKIPEKSYVG